MDMGTFVALLPVAGVLALLTGVAAGVGARRGRRRERAAVPVEGVIRSVLHTDEGTSLRLGLAWPAPDGSGLREGVWHGGSGPGWRVGQRVPLRVGRDDDFVQLAVAPRQSRVDGCVSAAALVIGVVLLGGGLLLR